jgi:two-component system, OmpR family, sensor histidine kinase MprB
MLVTIVASSVAVYFGVRQYLYDQLDAALSKSRTPASVRGLELLERGIESGQVAPPAPPPGQPDYFQYVNGDGRVVAVLGPARLPVTGLVRSVAQGTHPDAFFNVTVAGSPVRVYAFHLDGTTAVEIGHSLTDLTSALHGLLAVSAVVAAAGVALAIVIGALVAFAALRPVRRFSAAVTAVAETGELSHHVEISGHDEFSQVASGFNAMLDALGESLSRQRRLVADASHVLRTPLATVRTNVEVLRRADELDAGERAQLIRDTVAQTAALTHLVNNLIELARGEEETGAFGTVRLDDLVASIVEEARRDYPSVPFDLSTVPTTVWGSPDRLSKALGNLLDNAAKWTRPSTSVEVTVEDRSVTVRDHGPGIDAADVPRIFDRFYRSLSARGVPGSGLGLAIAKQAVEAHGGHIEVRDAVGGGAEFVVRFPEPRAN